jgi:hypothetical protein
MKQGLIGINLLYDDGQSIFIENSLFSNLYIANIDQDANEIPYEKLGLPNRMYANLFIIKINQIINEMHNMNVLKAIFSKKNLAEVELRFPNKTVGFHLASDADPFLEKSVNNYDKSFFQEESLCLLICPYELKYKNHLFT